jgi:hypothetical protein
MKSIEDFQKMFSPPVLLERAQAAADWLLRSIQACRGQGSSVFYSRWYHPLRGWNWPYPETTGYIIPTLIDYAAFSENDEYKYSAIKQAQWILSLQYNDGALPGGAVKHGKKAMPSVFNTGQMLLGLCAAYDVTQNSPFLDGAHRAAQWLVREIDPNARIWKKHAYRQGYSPAYYTHVCWPILEVYKRTNDEMIKAGAVEVLNTIASWANNNGTFKNWGFRPDQPAFTHTIGYTLWGFLAASEIQGNDGKLFYSLAECSARIFLDLLKEHGRLAGAYDQNIKGRYWYTCLTGNCQIALTWMKLFEKTGEKHFLDGAIQALEPVMKSQRKGLLDPNIRGTIPGSRPIWGRYLFMRYPNWATKFYLDALMQLSRLLKSPARNE